MDNNLNAIPECFCPEIQCGFTVPEATGSPIQAFGDDDTKVNETAKKMFTHGCLINH